MRRGLALVLAFALALVLAACRTGDGRSNGPTASSSGQRRGPAPVYVAVGSTDSLGEGAEEPVRDGWPKVFFREALPRQAVLVNFSRPRATVSEALLDQVPDALVLRPTVVTVSLQVDDILAGTPVAAYEADLGQLVRRLRRGGAARVLVANAPSLDGAPVDGDGAPVDGDVPSPSVLDAMVASYNEAVRRVAAREGAVLVDVHGAVGETGGFWADDDVVPTTAGHQVVAKAFAAASRRAG